MRNIVITLLLCLHFVSFAQINETFSDGDLTKSPEWFGCPNSFVINSDKQLQLNETTSGTTYLSTPIAFGKGQTWEFCIKLGFNPSSLNYEKVWLVSNTLNPKAATKGYFLYIGGVNDKISLYKQRTSVEEEIIPGTEKELDKSIVNMQVKVEYTVTGKWRLFVRQDNEAEYLLKGEYLDKDPKNGNYFSLEYFYTASYGKKIWFDNLIITAPTLKDTVPPGINSLSVLNNTQLSISFTEAIDTLSAKFEIPGINISKVSFAGDCESATITSLSPFLSNGRYKLLPSAVKDYTGNFMPDTTVIFTYVPLLEKAQMGDIVISEIMANPSGELGLPNAEYIELHNNSNLQVDLKDWKLYYGDKAYTFPEHRILPDSNVIILLSTNTSLFTENVNSLGLNTFPTLANTGKLLSLESPQGVVTSFADYTDQWYRDDFRANGGFSIECIDTHNLSSSLINWRASQNLKGGTPGARNSIAADNPDTVSPVIMQSSLSSPNTVLVQFSKAMNRESVTNSSNYTIVTGNNAIQKIDLSSPVPSSATLTLSDSIKHGDILSFELASSISCISGNKLTGNRSIRLAIPDSLEIGDVIINEILFNPKPSGADYVEIYNRSNRIIDVSKLQITSRKSDGTLQAGIRLATNIMPFFPNEYIVLTTDKSAVCSFYECKATALFDELATMPSFPDDAGNVQLANAAGTVIDGFSYSEKMHHPFIKDPEGVALERIDPNRPTNDATNWQSASSTSGYGTPGYQNSQQYLASDFEKKGFWLESETVTPDNNGKEDVLRINYKLDEEGFTANIRIYDRSGKLINAIASNTILGSEGILDWDATDTSHQLVKPGIYILFIEYYKRDKAPVRLKIPVVVGN
ncbi:MAG: lamin tail domain-containing protein [Bacteroidota bacterium]|nr:lamin tail domain-containing protein [Bacteroidota bacterium]